MLLGIRSIQTTIKKEQNVIDHFVHNTQFLFKHLEYMNHIYQASIMILIFCSCISSKYKHKTMKNFGSFCLRFFEQETSLSNDTEINKSNVRMIFIRYLTLNGRPDSCTFMHSIRLDSNNLIIGNHVFVIRVVFI